jgi:hypothetical protein
LLDQRIPVYDSGVGDPTITARVRRYRSRLAERGLTRFELTVPTELKPVVPAVAAGATDPLRQALATINAPRPHPADGRTLLGALFEPDEKYRPHIEALFDEVPRQTLHRLVLSGHTTFSTLAAARRLWKVGGRHAEWIDEMARFGVARAARVHPPVR